MARRFMVIALLACVVCMLAFATGCRNSDALKEIIIDQTSSNIDYENESKYLINDASSDIQDDRVAAQESNKRGLVTEEKQNIVVYSSNPNAPQYLAKQSVWSKDPDFHGIEASSAVAFYQSDDPEATEQDIALPPEEEPQQEEEEEEEEKVQLQVAEATGRNADEGEDGAGASPSRGKRTGSEGEELTEKEAPVGGGKGADEEEQPPEAPSGTDNDPDPEPEPEPEPGPEPTPSGDDNPGGAEEEKNPGEDPGVTPEVPDIPAPVEDTSSTFTKLPPVDHIAAVGQLAVVVQMVGGEGALVAADAEILDSSFSTVFADEGAASIVEAWPDDGSPETIDMDAIEASGAQLLIVDTPNFTEAMPSEQRQKLNKLIDEGKIQKVMYADLSNSSSIKSFVRKVGESLGESTVIGNAGRTGQIADNYVAFHDDLVWTCAHDANGGLAYDMMSGDETVYELGGNTGKLSSGKQLDFNAEPKFTLLLDEWDDSVRYVYGDVWNPSMSGIALSYAGYADTPVSYYLQAAGLVNNAAARGDSDDPGMYPVWQFSSLPVLKDLTYVRYALGGPFDNSATPTRKRSAGTAWDNILLTTSYNMSQGSANAGTSYGTTLFPRLIAATQEIKDNMMQNSEGDEDAYHPYEMMGDDVRGARGFIADDESVIYSCIGSTGSSGTATRTIGESISDEDIVVNPHGLFSSWTEYGSVESVLEAAWATDVVNGDEEVDWQDKVIEFYDTFYRYDCSGDMATIEDGVAR